MRALTLLLTFLLLLLPRQPAAALSQREIPASFQLIAENATFELYFNAATLAFKVRDTRNGYLWHSNLDEKAQGDRLNKPWLAFAQSGVSIDYLDQKANTKRASLTNARHTVAIQPIENGIQAQVWFEEPSIGLTLRLQLEEAGVRVEVPAESIQEKGEFRLALLYLYPWLGATRVDQTGGYIFLPDGSGALIRFSPETKADNMYYGRYYGADLGMTGSMPFDPNLQQPYPISVPVFGMAHGEDQNAYLTVLEEGAPYAEIQAHPAGVITNFNFIYNAFIYNEAYFQRTNRAGDGVTVIQPQTNRYDVVMHYRFLSGPEANYVGMARSYQRYLLEKGVLKPAAAPPKDIGIRLEFLGAEQETILFWKRTIPMTTVAQMEEILDTLQVSNPQVVYYGWQPRGASAMPPAQMKLDGKLGSLSELKALIQRLTERGGTFSLYFDPLAIFQHERRAISRYRLAMSIANVAVQGYRRGAEAFYYNLPALEERFGDFSRSVQTRLPGAGIALDTIGSLLYSDFRKGQNLNRVETLRAYQRLLAQTPVPLAFYAPNDYLWEYATACYDLPITSNGYTYVSETVPFVQIVLSGHLPCYGEPLNFSPDLRADLLRHAEYGVYPSFILTYEDTARILDTRSRWIYVSSYHQLQHDIETAYAWLNALLAPLQGASIIAHRQIAEGVTITTYSNGMQILVNYRETHYTVDGLTIPAREAVLREATP